MVADRPSQEGRMSAGAPNDPMPFGKYYLLGLIARGGMAEVYRARHIARALPGTPRGKLMAIKVMRPQLAREARFVDMFHREAKLALMLKNRCIVDTVEVGQHDGRHYIAMEYVAGRDLTQVLRRCQENQQHQPPRLPDRIPVPHAVFIAARIAEGLHFAHNLVGPDGRPLNLVNRDVSPSNVRLSYDGDVKLLDFGIAQALMKFTSEIGILKGKFSYMSPEQIRGMPLDARTDVFSAGIILHEMLTTEKLFRGDTEFALMEKVRKADVPPPSNFNRRVTAELDQISLKALARDVMDRYQNASQLAADLDALIAGYRFDPKELRQFMRQLFRAEYAREIEDTEMALESEPGMTMSVTQSGRMIPGASASGVMPLAGGTTTSASQSGSVPQQVSPASSGPTQLPSTTEVGDANGPPAGDDAPFDPGGGDKPRGFWGSLFRKKK